MSYVRWPTGGVCRDDSTLHGLAAQEKVNCGSRFSYVLTPISESIMSISNYDALGRTTKVIPPDGTSSANNISTTSLL